MLTLDIEPLQGLHLSATLECLDDRRESLGYGRTRGSRWLTLAWFF